MHSTDMTRQLTLILRGHKRSTIEPALSSFVSIGSVPNQALGYITKHASGAFVRFSFSSMPLEQPTI